MIHTLLRRWLFPNPNHSVGREPARTRLRVEALESRDQPSALPIAGLDQGESVPVAARHLDSEFDEGFGYEEDPFYYEEDPSYYEEDPFYYEDPYVQDAIFVEDPFAPAPFVPFADPELVFINQLVVANLQAVFAQPIPLGGPVVGAAITAIDDLNGDGFFDVSAVVVLHAGPGQFIAFALDFDGLSPYGELLGPPIAFDPFSGVGF